MANVKLGFTGTQDGMSDVQKKLFGILVKRINPIEFHHGDCIGADSDAHDIVIDTTPTCEIVGHPPDRDNKRAFKQFDRSFPPKPYLARNKDIVENSTMMIACPSGEEVLRSGTWATVRHTRKQSKYFLLIIYPDGKITKEVLK